MCKILTDGDIDKLNILAVDLNIIESLSRILLELIRDNENLEYYDVENLSNVLRQRIIETSKKFRNIHHELEFGI